MTRCFGRGLDQLDDRWKIYVELLAGLADKLSTNYNVETIIAPLDVQISEAIMNFQENAQNITTIVSRTCDPAMPSGGPMYGSIIGHSKLMGSKPGPVQHDRLSKRAAPLAPAQARVRHGSNTLHHMSGDDSLPAYEAPVARHSGSQTTTRAKNFAGRLNNYPANPSSEDLGQVAYSRLANQGSIMSPNIALIPATTKRKPVFIKEIKESMLKTKTFWSSLPRSVCTSNGSTIVSLSSMMGLSTHGLADKQQQTVLSAKSPNCFQESLGLTDINSDLRYRNDIKEKVIAKLDNIISVMKDAMNGVEIDWNGLSHEQQNGFPSSTQVSSQAGSTNSLNGRQPSQSSASSGKYPNHMAVTPVLPSSTRGEDETEPEDDNIEGSGEAECDSPPCNSEDQVTTPEDGEDYPDGDETTTDQNSTSDEEEPEGEATKPSVADDNSEQVNGGNSIDTPIGMDPTKGGAADFPKDFITPPDAQKSGATSVVFDHSSPATTTLLIVIVTLLYQCQPLLSLLPLQLYTRC